MSTLERAVAIAARAHAGQTKRGVEPFLLHVLRVTLAVDDARARIAAALHDVVEKTDWTRDALRDEGFAADVLAAVDAVTEREGEGREAFVRRAAADPLGRLVKRADLDDNERFTRTLPPSDENRERLARYARERRILEEAASAASADRPSADDEADHHA